jgi:hypothetical protein
VRRRFFDALATAPESRYAMDLILALYRVGALARQAGVVRTAAHHQPRELLSAPVLAQLHSWLEQQAPRHPPKGPLTQAISYALKSPLKTSLELFVEHSTRPSSRAQARRPPDGYQAPTSPSGTALLVDSTCAVKVHLTSGRKSRPRRKSTPQ